MSGFDKPDKDAQLALLIDADNASTEHLDRLMSEIAAIGRASVRRVYGDWTKPQLGSWKGRLLNYSLQPIQQFAYTTGKNATDSALIIDAMDLLYTGRFDGFCLVTSDSDYTRLAQRMREQVCRYLALAIAVRQKPLCKRVISSLILRCLTTIKRCLRWIFMTQRTCCSLWTAISLSL